MPGKLLLKRMVVVKAIVTDMFKENMRRDLQHAANLIVESVIGAARQNVKNPEAAEKMDQAFRAAFTQLFTAAESLFGARHNFQRYQAAQAGAPGSVWVPPSEAPERELTQAGRGFEQRQQELAQLIKNCFPPAALEELSNKVQALIEMQDKLLEIHGLELGAEYVQGPIEGLVEVAQGDNLYQLIGNTEVVLKDGQVIAIRETGGASALIS